MCLEVKQMNCKTKEEETLKSPLLCLELRNADFRHLRGTVSWHLRHLWHVLALILLLLLLLFLLSFLVLVDVFQQPFILIEW